jgi:hypothetical protein
VGVKKERGRKIKAWQKFSLPDKGAEVKKGKG